MIPALTILWRHVTQTMAILRTLAIRGHRADRELTDEEVARIVAEVVGPDSAAARAVADLDRRRAAGIDAELRSDGLGQWVVASRGTPWKEPHA